MLKRENAWFRKRHRYFCTRCDFRTPWIANSRLNFYERWVIPSAQIRHNEEAGHNG